MRKIAGLGVMGVLFVAGLALSQAPPQGYEYEIYPLKVGNKWVYRAGNEKVVIEVVKEEPFTRKFKGPDGKEATLSLAGYVLNVSSGNRILQEHVGVMEDGVYRLSAAGKQIQPPLAFIKALKQGETSWKIDSTSDGTPLKGQFFLTRSRVKVPMGEFVAEVVTSKDFQTGDQRMEVESWYAKDLGMVKQRVRYGAQETLLELESFTKGK